MNTGFASSTGKKIAASLKASFVLPLLFLGVGGQAPIVMAQSPGTFTATGKMTTARTDHSATLLLNGKVLIAGGYRQALPDLVLASAELYDPSSGTFAPTGDMTAEAPDNGLLAPELAAGISRAKSAKTQGIRTGNWLSQRPRSSQRFRACKSSEFGSDSLAGNF